MDWISGGFGEKLFGLKILEFNAVKQRSRDSAQLVSDLWDDKHDGIDSRISVNVKAVEIYLLSAGQEKVLKHHRIVGNVQNSSEFHGKNQNQYRMRLKRSMVKMMKVIHSGQFFFKQWLSAVFWRKKAILLGSYTARQPSTQAYMTSQALLLLLLLSRRNSPSPFRSFHKTSLWWKKQWVQLSSVWSSELVSLRLHSGTQTVAVFCLRSRKSSEWLFFLSCLLSSVPWQQKIK